MILVCGKIDTGRALILEGAKVPADVSNETCRNPGGKLNL